MSFRSEARNLIEWIGRLPSGLRFLPAATLESILLVRNDIPERRKKTGSVVNTGPVSGNVYPLNDAASLLYVVILLRSPGIVAALPVTVVSHTAVFLVTVVIR